MKEVQYTGKEKVGRAVSGVVSLSGVVALGLFAFNMVPNMDAMRAMMAKDSNNGADIAVVEQVGSVSDQNEAVVSDNMDEVVIEDDYEPVQEKTTAAEQTTVSVMDAVYGKVIAEYQSTLESESDLIRFYIVPPLKNGEYPQLLVERQFQTDEYHLTYYKDLEYASQLYTTISFYSWSQSRSEVYHDYVENRDFIRPTVYIGNNQDQSTIFVACNDPDNPQNRMVGSIGYHSFKEVNELAEGDPALTPVTPHTNISELKQAFYDAVQS